MIQENVLKGARKVYSFIAKPDFSGFPWPKDDEWGTTNKLMFDLFSSDRPCFVGRMGTVECSIVVNYIFVHSQQCYLRKCWKYISDNARMPIWEKGKPFYELQNNAGFFTKGAISIADVEKFAELYLKDIPQMDVCGRFYDPERFLPFNKSCKMVQLESLYPFFSPQPWTKTLEGKKVLVVHPFKDTILSQYNNYRHELFKNRNVLPDFQLDVIKAVQSIAGEDCGFQTWFDALDYMKEEIVKRDFDVLIVGCGAYGLPLAAFGKSLGKKALHLGGGTQLLFGIKGKRWEGHYHGDDTRFADLFNEHWVYPSEKEIPKNAKLVEGGCYWK